MRESMRACDKRWRGILLAAMLWGCSHQEAATVPQSLVFRPQATSNNGRPVYVLIRVVSENEFLTDSYRKIAGLVYPSSTDPSVLGVALVWPEREQTLKVEVPKGKAVGIYAMFTRPGDQWKMLLGEPGKYVYRAMLEAGTLRLEPVTGKNK